MAACFVKTLLVIINFVLWAIGGGMIGGAVYILVSEPGSLPYVEMELIASAKAVLYICIALGAILFIIGFLGCCGALAESKGMLKLYMTILTTLLMGEIGIAVYLYFMKSQFLSYVQIGWNYLDQTTKDLVQDQLKCCGLQNYTEYQSNWNNTFSCYQNISDPSTMYENGCYDMFVRFLLDNLTYSASIGGSLVGLEVVGILLSCYAMKAFEKASKVGPGQTMPRNSRVNRQNYSDRQAWEI